MPRGEKSKTIASRIFENLEDELEEEGTWLVFYDFKGKISNYFYKNLKVIQKTLGDGEWLQNSVFQCKFLRTAKAIKILAERYGAQVYIFKAELVE